MRALRILLVAVLGLTACFGQYDPAPRAMSGGSGSSLGTVAQLGLSNAVYLAMRTDGSAGTGAQWDPYDVSTPAKWSSVWKNNDFSYKWVVCIPNTSANPYLIEGNGDGTSNNTWQMPHGCVLVINGCYLKLNSLTNPTPTMIGTVYNADGDGAGVIGYGATLDGNATALGASTSNSINAIKLYGNKCFMLGVKAINMYGNTGGSEGFTFTFATYTDGGGEHDVSGCYGKDLTEDSFQGNYGGTFLTFTTSTTKSCQAIWDNCKVFNKLGASSNFSTCGFGGTGVGPVTMINPYAENVTSMFYYEGGIANYKAIGAVGKNLRNAGVSLNGQGGGTFNHMEFDQCDFEMNDADVGSSIKHGVHITNTSDANCTNIVFNDLKIRFKDVTGTTTPTGLNITACKQVFFNNALIDSSLAASIIGGTKMVEFNNVRTFTGTQVAGIPRPVANYSSWKPTCRVATAAVLPNSPTYDNGSSGVGASFEAGANAALTIDSTSMAVGDVVLVKNQATGANNGIYIVTDAGSGSTHWKMVRHWMADEPEEMRYQIFTIQDGSNAGALFVCGPQTVTVGSTSLSYNAILYVNSSAQTSYAVPSGQQEYHLSPTTFTSRINLSATNNTPGNGDLWNDNTQRTLLFRQTGMTAGINQCLFSATASATVANSTSETTILGTGIGAKTLPANLLNAAGKQIRVKCWGTIGNTVTPTLQVKCKLGSTAVVDTTAVTMSAITGTNMFQAEFVLTCRTTGSSGTVFGQGGLQYKTANGLAPLEISGANTGTSTIDLTASQALDVTVQWGTSNASNTLTCTNVSITVEN